MEEIVAAKPVHLTAARKHREGAEWLSSKASLSEGSSSSPKHCSRDQGFHTGAFGGLSTSRSQLGLSDQGLPEFPHAKRGPSFPGQPVPLSYWNQKPSKGAIPMQVTIAWNWATHTTNHVFKLLMHFVDFPLKKKSTFTHNSATATQNA